MPNQPSKKPNGLKCEICGKPLIGKQRRACSDKCRNQLRSVAGAEVKKRATEIAETQALTAVQTEMQKQVGKITQEALRGEVEKQLQGFVFLIPTALAALKNNLEHGDIDQKQKAATTLLRYTLGNPSVAPPSLEVAPEPMQIVFAVPRSDTLGPAPGGGVRPITDAPLIEAPIIDVESTALDSIDTCTRLQCMECGLEKCVDEFVGASRRCKDCDRKLKDRVEKQFGHVNLG